MTSPQFKCIVREIVKRCGRALKEPWDPDMYLMWKRDLKIGDYVLNSAWDPYMGEICYPETYRLKVWSKSKAKTVFNYERIYSSGYMKPEEDWHFAEFSPSELNEDLKRLLILEELSQI